MPRREVDPEERAHRERLEAWARERAEQAAAPRLALASERAEIARLRLAAPAGDANARVMLSRLVARRLGSAANGPERT